MSDIVNEVLAARYFREGESSWEDVCRRVADYVGNTDDEREIYYDMMVNKDFVPNSPTLMNAGTNIGQLSACFVLPIYDSMESIFDAIKNAALIHKTGGGTGFSFGNLRPEGDRVNGTDGVASGPISFMKVFNAATEAVKQGGRRRGANMGILPIWHPDIEKFITCKNTEGDLSNFNISVMIDDDFINAVNNDKEYNLHFEGKIYKTIRAKELFDKIVDGIITNGEPGVLFYDTINDDNTCKHLGKYEATNPCSEQILLPYESCNLGSINLSNFIDNNKLDTPRLNNTIEQATEFLDKIIDLNKYPIEEIAEASKKTRKIGLGYMGFHHMLMKMGIPYDSSDALYQARLVMGILDDTSVATSRELAKALGTFPAYEGSQWFLQDIPMRNATTTCIAPTGSIATLSETSYGIEPVFSLVHKRYTWVDGEKKGYLMVDPVFEEKLDEYIETHNEFSQWDKKKQEVINHAYETGTIQDITWLPVEFKSVFKTALDIDWKAHIDMQAAFQQYCHAAISKTINMPSGATKDDIRSAILYAYEKKCKGVTIYVTGSRNDIVMELKKESTSTPTPTDERILPKRPADLPATNSKRRSGCGKLIISVAEKDGKPYECIINNKGGCTAMNDALGQMISLSMRWNVPTWDIIKTLRNVTCPVAYKKFTEGKCDGKSCSDVIGRVIESLIPDKDLEPTPIRRKEKVKTEHNICPDCGERMSMVEGCVTCACGYSRCG
jgi:ribonucleoside-diphosphate reductase alpha chain